MQYQITCLSPCDKAKKLADAFARMLPPDTFYTDLNDCSAVLGDVHLVGFELEGRNLNSVPLKIMEYLELLEGKVIFLFATTPFQPSDMIQSGINRAVIPFLPRDCDYRGLYICPAQPADEVLEGLASYADRDPQNTRASYWLENCRKSVGHPDTDDIQKACAFARHVLKLESKEG